MATFQPYKDYKPVDLNFTKQIPSDWIVKRGKFLFREVSERSKKGEEQLLSVSEHKGIVPRDSINVTMFQALSYEGYKLCNKGDIVVNSLWAWHRGLGVSEYHGIVSTAYGVYRPIKPEQWNHRYLNYLLRDRTYVGECLIRSKGIWESRYQLTGSNFLDIPILQPPLEVQNQIVAYLDRKTAAIDKFIRNKERLIELLEEERREFIDSQINQSFNNASIKPLKYVVRLVSEQTTKKKDDEIYLSLEQIESWTGKIDLTIGTEEFESNVKRFSENDVLFNKLRPYLAKVVIPDFKGVCVSELLVLRPSKQIIRVFLYYKLISRRFIDFVDSSTYGSKMPRASWDFIGKVEVQFPNELKIQQEIISEIQEEEIRVEQLKKKVLIEIEKIKEYREALITNAVTGRIVVSG